MKTKEFGEEVKDVVEFYCEKMVKIAWHGYCSAAKKRSADVVEGLFSCLEHLALALKYEVSDVIHGHEEVK